MRYYVVTVLIVRDTAGMMRDSAPPVVVERPGLEDVAEEEDVFVGEGSSKSTLEPGSCQVCLCLCVCVYWPVKLGASLSSQQNSLCCV